ncbi:hypothetical protein BC830DRAFT_1063517 [Chytriomyces sp. MP71]|nr:hypothetical protein BC830DRAFT_1063517 [Chytriomyces sp. MP71]
MLAFSTFTAALCFIAFIEASGPPPTNVYPPPQPGGGGGASGPNPANNFAGFPSPAKHFHANRQYPNSSPGSYSYPACGFPSVRKEWRKLTPGLQQHYLDAVQCLMATHSILTNESMVSRSVYDDFAYSHSILVARVHGTALFLPWHRTLIQLFEYALQDFCGYLGSLPYWDWTLDAASPSSSPIFAENSFGGSGTGSPPCISSGRFASATVLITHPAPQCITRSFSNGPQMGSNAYNAAVVGALVRNGGRWLDFYSQLYEGPHSAVHNAVGGDFGNPPAAGNDPLFWVHHAMVDKIWNDWQDANPGQETQYFGNRDSTNPAANDALPTDALNLGVPALSGRSLFPEMTVRDAIWSDGGGWFCYIYA